MTKTITVVFDGKSFVPTEPVDLPAGTRTSLVVTGVRETPEPAGRPPRPMTEDEKQEWGAFLTDLRSVPPDPPTFEEYLRQQRGHP